ncbi:MAG: SDR family NAD(P)-dependent oxidoreductase [Pseudomonadota bacterium]
MTMAILITGATDGIGLATAKQLAEGGHTLLLHGRNPQKLKHAKSEVATVPGTGPIETYAADLSDLSEAASLAAQIQEHHDRLDVLINNAGVYKTPNPTTPDGADVRFVVNTLAPYLITQHLKPIMKAGGRIVNLSSAAQASVDPEALAGRRCVDDMEAYAQSKLALTMWTRAMAEERADHAPIVVAVNPGSLLASKMVKEGFGVPGSDIRVGADILTRAALSDEFADANGKYFDNDSHRFANPHADAMDLSKCAALVKQIEAVIGA